MKKTLRLAQEWVRLNTRMSEIEKDLEKEYLKNPIKCKYCGRDLEWKRKGWINQQGLSLMICDCIEDMK